MKMILIAAGAALLIAAPLAAQTEKEVKKKESDDKFAKQDLDGDGTLTLSEIQKTRNERNTALRRCGEKDDELVERQTILDRYDGYLTVEEFLRFDVNNDGKLNRDDYKKAQSDPKPYLNDRDDASDMADTIFAEWHDYTGTEGESIKLSAFDDRVKTEQKALRQAAGNDMKKRRALLISHSRIDSYHLAVRADANDDEIITREELTAFYVAKYEGELKDNWSPDRKEWSDKDRDRFHQAYYRQVIASLDANDDGSLSRNETNFAYNALSDSEWDKYDANEDGVLDREELKKVSEDPNGLLLVTPTIAAEKSDADEDNESDDMD